MDQGLADGHLGDVVDRDGRVGHELLHDETPDRDERQARRRERHEGVADGRQHHGADRDRADPPAHRGTGGDDRADERRRATDPRDHAEHGRTELEVVEDEQEPGRPEDPPQRSEGHPGAHEGSKDRVVTDEAETDPDLGQDGFAVLGLRWRSLRFADRAQQHGRDEVRDGIDGDGDRRRQELDEEAADPERHELGCGSAGRQGTVRLDQAVAVDDRREVGVVGRVEEGGQDRRQT